MKFYDVYLEGGHIIPIQDPRDDIGPEELLIEVMSIFPKDICMPAIKKADVLNSPGAIIVQKIVAIVETGKEPEAAIKP